MSSERQASPSPLWVVEDNGPARRFYESAQWRPDGGRKVDDRFGTGVTEVRYRIDLAAAS